MSVGKILLLLTAIAVLAGLLAGAGFFLLERDDISDPVVLAGMPVEELRDVEVETLIRAAFRSAKQVTLTAEMPERQPHKKVIIADQATLQELADNFFVGRDEIRPAYPHPGVTYTRVEFTGPLRPNFEFTDDKRIWIRGGSRHVEVPGKFSVTIGDLLGL